MHRFLPIKLRYLFNTRKSPFQGKKINVAIPVGSAFVPETRINQFKINKDLINDPKLLPALVQNHHMQLNLVNISTALSIISKNSSYARFSLIKKLQQSIVEAHRMQIILSSSHSTRAVIATMYSLSKIYAANPAHQYQSNYYKDCITLFRQADYPNLVKYSDALQLMMLVTVLVYFDIPHLPYLIPLIKDRISFDSTLLPGHLLTIWQSLLRSGHSSTNLDSLLDHRLQEMFALQNSSNVEKSLLKPIDFVYAIYCYGRSELYSSPFFLSLSKYPYNLIQLDLPHISMLLLQLSKVPLQFDELFYETIYKKFHKLLPSIDTLRVFANCIHGLYNHCDTEEYVSILQKAQDKFLSMLSLQQSKLALNPDKHIDWQSISSIFHDLVESKKIDAKKTAKIVEDLLMGEICKPEPQIQMRDFQQIVYTFKKATQKPTEYEPASLGFKYQVARYLDEYNRKAAIESTPKDS